MEPASFYTHSFLSTISPLSPQRSQEGDIPEGNAWALKEVPVLAVFLSPRTLCYSQHGPVSYRSYVMECCSLITGCQKKWPERLSWRLSLWWTLLECITCTKLLSVCHRRRDWTQLSPDFWDTSSFSEATILEAAEWDTVFPVSVLNLFTWHSCRHGRMAFLTSKRTTWASSAIVNHDEMH